MHGYTLTDIHQLALGAIQRARTTGMDVTDRYDAAWHEIAETLCTSGERPGRGQLIVAGANAIDRLAQDYGHTWGFDRRNPDAGFEAMSGFRRYWILHARPTRFDSALIDRLAVRQIWPMLSPAHQEVLLALAMHGDPAAAAEATGMTCRTFTTHLNDARREFRALWHEHETPSRMWGKEHARRGFRTATQTLRNRRQQQARRAAAKALAVAAAELTGRRRVMTCLAQVCRKAFVQGIDPAPESGQPARAASPAKTPVHPRFRVLAFFHGRPVSQDPGGNGVAGISNRVDDRGDRFRERRQPQGDGAEDPR